MAPRNLSFKLEQGERPQARGYHRTPLTEALLQTLDNEELIVRLPLNGHLNGVPTQKILERLRVQYSRYGRLRFRRATAGDIIAWLEPKDEAK